MTRREVVTGYVLPALFGVGLYVLLCSLGGCCSTNLANPAASNPSNPHAANVARGDCFAGGVSPEPPAHPSPPDGQPPASLPDGPCEVPPECGEECPGGVCFPPSLEVAASEASTPRAAPVVVAPASTARVVATGRRVRCEDVDPDLWTCGELALLVVGGLLVVAACFYFAARGWL